MDACGASEGMTMYAGMPRILAAQASAAAWFPELCVTTPCTACSSDRLNTEFIAPLNLKAPLHEQGTYQLISCAGGTSMQ